VKRHHYIILALLALLGIGTVTAVTMLGDRHAMADPPPGCTGSNC
jgi:hypothetical protein